MTFEAELRLRCIHGISLLALLIGLSIVFGRRGRSNQHHAKPSSPPTPPVSGHTSPDPSPAASASPVPQRVVITGPAYVTDGDGLRIQKTEIRLFGIDAPEFSHPLGKKARWALVNLCKGQDIRAELTGTDDHGRMVAKCYLPDGRDLSAEMVKQGLALDWAKFSGGIYRRFEPADVRKKLRLADARQIGRMYVWERFEAKQRARLSNTDSC